MGYLTEQKIKIFFKGIKSRSIKAITAKKKRAGVKKIIGNPMIVPKDENSWESWQTFNPAAIFIKDKVHFLYRAIGDDGISRFGYANSKDGFELSERHPLPVYQDPGICGKYVYYSFASGGSWGGCEDARMARIDKGNKIYMIYTSCSDGLRISLSSIKVNDFLNKKWYWPRNK